MIPLVRCLLLTGLLGPMALLAAEPLVLDVWPEGKPPGVKEIQGGEKVEPDKPGARKVTRLTNIDRPSIHVFRPAKDKNTGAAVVVCPGGGYSILAWDLEGTEVAQWLTRLGVTAIVLKYRVPRPKGLSKGEQPLGPFQDVQRAIRLVRSKAKEWDIDPNRLGVLGFSAGGHLAASAAVRHATKSYEPMDEIDKLSARPDFAVLVYPAYLVTEKRDALRPEFKPDRSAPKFFFAHASDDPVPAENSALMYLALKDANVKGELHLFEVGGHGFGLRPSKDPVSQWPDRCEAWMRRNGWLEQKPISEK
ncbi:MAG: alpha/beta hydrolase [Gemmataceae bacterium]